MVGQFYATAIIAMGINAGSMYLFHGILAWNDIISAFFAAIATFLFNFGFSKKILGKKKSPVINGDLSLVTIVK